MNNTKLDAKLDKKILRIINESNGKIIKNIDLVPKLLHWCRKEKIEVIAQHREKVKRWFAQRLRILEERKLIKRTDQLPNIYFMLTHKGEFHLLPLLKKCWAYTKEHPIQLLLNIAIIARLIIDAINLLN